MIVVAPIAQIAPIVNGLTDFRINGLTNGMVGWGLGAVRAVTTITPVRAVGAVMPITAAGKVRAVRLGIEAIVCIDDIEGWRDDGIRDWRINDRRG